MLTILLIAAPAAAVAAQPANCPKIDHHVVTKTEAGIHRLDQEPQPNGYYTVLRTDARGCATPVKFKVTARR